VAARFRVSGTSAVRELEDWLLLPLTRPRPLPLLLLEPRDDIVAFYWVEWLSGTVVGFGVVMWNSGGFRSGDVALGVRPVRLPLSFSGSS
jgi:hypothetical protein